jgi:hypothetical protein
MEYVSGVCDSKWRPAFALRSTNFSFPNPDNAVRVVSLNQHSCRDVIEWVFGTWYRPVFIPAKRGTARASTSRPNHLASGTNNLQNADTGKD